MGQNVDQTSIGMTFATILMQVVTSATNNNAMMTMTILVGLSTIAYNIVKTIQLLRKKK